MPLKSKTAVASIALATALASPASAGVQVRTDLDPGEVVQASSGLRAAVPEPGHLVFAGASRVTGATESLTVATHRDGTVVVTEGATDPPPTEPVEDLLGLPPGECEDGAYKRLDYSFPDGADKHVKWKSTFGWWYRAKSTPPEVSVANAREAVRRAVRNIVGSENTCGLADTVTATQDYLGDTTTTPNWGPDGYGCSSPDGKNVVSFGNSDWGYLAETCVYAIDDGGRFARIYDSDTMINKEYESWYAERPTICMYPYEQVSIETVMTHHFGFTFGLWAVDDYEHPSLTMSAALNGPCQEDETTLGLGDVWGLRSLY